MPAFVLKLLGLASKYWQITLVVLTLITMLGLFAQLRATQAQLDLELQLKRALADSLEIKKTYVDPDTFEPRIITEILEVPVEVPVAPDQMQDVLEDDDAKVTNVTTVVFDPASESGSGIAARIGVDAWSISDTLALTSIEIRLKRDGDKLAYGMKVDPLERTVSVVRAITPKGPAVYVDVPGVNIAGVRVDSQGVPDNSVISHGSPWSFALLGKAGVFNDEAAILVGGRLTRTILGPIHGEFEGTYNIQAKAPVLELGIAVNLFD